MKLPNLSNSMGVARLRYIQSIHERAEFRNPDTLVRYFMSRLERWRYHCLGGKQIAKLQADPFYYYLLARTLYYDDVLLDAISRGVRYIINVGCGSDTRAYRFVQIMKRNGVKVLECDQLESICAKQQRVKQLWLFDHVEYLPLDLNKEYSPEFEHRLAQTRTECLVLMEGVSTYVEESAFCRFLSSLSGKLPAGSRIAYDFKLRGADDNFGCVHRTQRLFRLPRASAEVAMFHAKRGHFLEHMELSSELSIRLLPSLTHFNRSTFSEDGLVRLAVKKT